ncbi:MAG TPA: UDP-N-acetylmuramoyl-tripeptide--D-alanyl-D-alanine ligase [Steroidobacteraceae bacterium]|jgi:UDP-N-acetylmuramoyl-tripeptide--D-alanyl-D-alanine ligase|nr:UDP-N-acetylmuramoyl-tripeptide--D-alanyl-D-alanine ligase [Steroidobacteraceae bacterium]
MSLTRSLSGFARACGGRLTGADGPYSDVVSDSRTLQSGQLFVALKGPNFNGRDFLAAALAAGAAGAVVDAAQPLALPQIVTDDTQAALTRAARSWRAHFSGPLIGVAGSNGKTTVKEMTARVLSEAGATLATRGNLNNHVGVPLTLLRLSDEHRFAVIEIGANHAGEVAALVAVARPTIGLITNAGAEHLEGFGSLEGVARAEGEMVAGLAPTGTAVINADDEFAALWRGLTRARVVTFGMRADADYRASAVATELEASGFRTRFRLESPLGSTAIELALGGAHNIANALAAAAAAVSAGATLAQVAAGLAAMRAVPGRLQVKRAVSGAWLIDDSYNANPSSMRAAIEVLASTAGRRWLALGDMAELGEFAAEAHAEIGEFARAAGIERLYATGELMQRAVASFGAGARWFADTADLTRALRAALASAGPEVRLLLKGSRFNRLERVADALTGAAGSTMGGH